MDADSIFIMVLAGVIVGPVALWFLSIPWLVSAEKKRQRQSVQSGVLGSFDELFHPEAYQANLVWAAQVELPAPAPSPGDGDLESGKIRIVVPAQNDSP